MKGLSLFLCGKRVFFIFTDVEMKSPSHFPHKPATVWSSNQTRQRISMISHGQMDSREYPPHPLHWLLPAPLSWLLPFVWLLCSELISWQGRYSSRRPTDVYIWTWEAIIKPLPCVDLHRHSVLLLCNSLQIPKPSCRAAFNAPLITAAVLVALRAQMRVSWWDGGKNTISKKIFRIYV